MFQPSWRFRVPLAVEVSGVARSSRRGVFGGRGGSSCRRAPSVAEVPGVVKIRELGYRKLEVSKLSSRLQSDKPSRPHSVQSCCVVTT